MGTANVPQEHPVTLHFRAASVGSECSLLVLLLLFHSTFLAAQSHLKPCSTHFLLVLILSPYAHVVTCRLHFHLISFDWSPSIWTALYFLTRLALPPLHSPVNSGVRWESLVKALLFYSPIKLHLAWIFPPFFCAYLCIQRPHGLLPLKAVYGLFVRQLKRSQFFYHRKEH